MPIFSRRRLQSMLCDLKRILPDDKRKKLTGEINSKKTKEALAAEAELTGLWALAKVADIEAEPVLPRSRRRPDARSPTLFPSGPSIIEIRAISDDEFSGKKDMERTVNIITDFANTIRRRTGQSLYFVFADKSTGGQAARIRCVDPNFKLTDQLKEQLRAWLTDPALSEGSTVRIVEGRTDVAITYKRMSPRARRYFTHMPPVAYDLEKNPLYRALEKKADQLKGAEEGDIRVVMIVDVGCDLLRNLNTCYVRELSGAEIVNHALRRLHIDVVVVISPVRHGTPVLAWRQAPTWDVNVFDARERVSANEYDRVRAMVQALPAPRLEGYQARSLHEQGIFEDDLAFHLPTRITTRRDGPMTIRISAKLLHAYLAGLIDKEQFERMLVDRNTNPFQAAASQGKAISAVRMEDGGLDQDDDYVMFDLEIDRRQAEIRSKKK